MTPPLKKSRVRYWPIGIQKINKRTNENAQLRQIDLFLWNVYIFLQVYTPLKFFFFLRNLSVPLRYDLNSNESKSIHERLI